MAEESRKYQQEESVRQFFNQIAPDYPQRFTEAQPFHQYFFEQRLRLATAGLGFNNKTILDIGAGTGVLYDFLRQKHTGFDYYACDIAEGMLRQSQIPPFRYQVGSITELSFPIAQFDYIFLLGVTSYLTDSQLQNHLNFIEKYLSPEGTAIISFTNRQSWDFNFRRLLKWLLPSNLFKKKVLNQPFKINAYCPKDIGRLTDTQFCVNRTDYFNFSSTILNALAPRLSIRLDRWLQDSKSSLIKRFFGGDFLVRLRAPSTFDIQYSIFNILLFSYYFPPIKSIGTLRNYNIYREFLRYFKGVEVITTTNRHRLQQEVFPTLPQVHEARTLDIRWWMSRKKNRHVHLAEGKKDKPWIRFLQRLLDSFPFNILVGDGGLIYIVSAYQKARKIIKTKEVKYLYSSFRPYSDHIPPYLLKIWRPGLTWIADFRDLQVDVNVKNTLAPRFQHWCNRRILAKADIVTTVSEGLAAHLRRYHDHVYVLRNGIGAATKSTKSKSPHDKFTIAYTGSMFRKKRDPSPLLSVLAELIREKQIDPDHLQLLYAGKDGALWQSWIEQYQLHDLFHDLGMLPLEKANQLQCSAHINLLLTFSSRKMNGNLTGKLYEYLGAQRPVLAIVHGSLEPELEAILDSLEIGITVYHQKASTNRRIKQFVLQYYQEWRNQGDISFAIDDQKLDRYRWEGMMERFMEYLAGK